MRFSFILSAFFLAATPALAAPPEIAPASVRDDVFPVLEASFPDGIVARPDVEYGNLVGYRPLTLDLYLHRDRASATPRPLVVWVHGGGWNRGDARTSGAYANFPAVLASLAARGYVVASVSYRMSGEARFPGPIQDVKSAIRYLRDHARDYGIDPARVIAWGGSAGGHLVALAATSCGVAAFEPGPSVGRLTHKAMLAAKPSTTSDCVQGAVIWYGAFDLAAHETEFPDRPGGDANVAALLGCEGGDECAAKAKAASPITYVDAKTPPMLLIHGTADIEVSPKQTEAMAARLRAVGVAVETLMIPDVGHGMIGKTPEATRAASLEALERSFVFIDKLAGVKR
jgi:acetyl esterase/lipase